MPENGSDFRRFSLSPGCLYLSGFFLFDFNGRKNKGLDVIKKWGNIKKIYVPEIGLADGLVHILYDKHKRSAQRESSN